MYHIMYCTTYRYAILVLLYGAAPGSAGQVRADCSASFTAACAQNNSCQEAAHACAASCQGMQHECTRADQCAPMLVHAA
eukprot:1158816-Pelagomonas_calceolata.AAC.4